MQLDNKRHIVQNAFDALREDRPFLKEIRLRDVRQRLGADVSLPTAIKWTRRLCKEHGLTYSGRNDLTPEMLLGIVHSHYMTGHSPSKIAANLDLSVDTVYRKLREYRRWCRTLHLDEKSKHTIQRYDNDFINTER